MTSDEKLDLILSELQGMKTDMQVMKTDMHGMKSEIQDLKTDMQGMKSEMQDMKAEMQVMKSEIQDLKQRVINIELHIENVTDRNIQLLAENFISLTNKLNEAVLAADKNLAYEVKVNYLVERVQILEKEVAQLKSKIA